MAHTQEFCFVFLNKFFCFFLNKTFIQVFGAYTSKDSWNSSPVEEDEVGRNHVEWKAAFESSTDFLLGGVALGYDVGHQELVFPLFSHHQRNTGLQHGELK